MHLSSRVLNIIFRCAECAVTLIDLLCTSVCVCLCGCAWVCLILREILADLVICYVCGTSADGIVSCNSLSLVFLCFQFKLVK